MNVEQLDSNYRLLVTKFLFIFPNEEFLFLSYTSSVFMVSFITIGVVHYSHSFLIIHHDIYVRKNIVMCDLVRFVSICTFKISNFYNFYLYIILA